jgi:predicted ATP-grasp superfamily ATP-dependent carboligase
MIGGFMASGSRRAHQARHRRLRILLTEGSSLSARQTLYALGPAGHLIDICDSRPALCLGRFSRYVRACHACPPFSTDPAGYLAFLEERLRKTRYDVLFPTHDQVYLLSRFRSELAKRVGLPVPNFAALEQVQSKARFITLLRELQLPHPPTVLVHSHFELLGSFHFPCYVKTDYSTAGCGVRYVGDQPSMQSIADKLEAQNLLRPDSPVLVQQAAPGVLSVAQAVFQEGNLVAAHCYMARALGVGGSARARISAAHPVVIEHLALLGAHLHWHGALTLDYIWDADRNEPQYIEANPRIGETLNATLSDLNLCEVLLQVGLGISISGPVTSREGLRTHSWLMTLLAHAQAGQHRRYLLRELITAALGEGLYKQSEDEITRWSEDPLSLIPAAYLAARLLLNPRRAAAFIESAVGNYALNATTIRKIRQWG